MRTPEQIIGKDRLLQLVFEGYVVVPAEPTNAMICGALEASLAIMAEKGVNALSPFSDYPPPGEVTRRCYSAMVAAAQEK